jgi:hypothetical protein
MSDGSHPGTDYEVIAQGTVKKLGKFALYAMQTIADRLAREQLGRDGMKVSATIGEALRELSRKIPPNPALDDNTPYYMGKETAYLTNAINGISVADVRVTMAFLCGTAEQLAQECAYNEKLSEDYANSYTQNVQEIASQLKEVVCQLHPQHSMLLLSGPAQYKPDQTLWNRFCKEPNDQQKLAAEEILSNLSPKARAALQDVVFNIVRDAVDGGVAYKLRVANQAARDVFGSPDLSLRKSPAALRRAFTGVPRSALRQLVDNITLGAEKSIARQGREDNLPEGDVPLDRISLCLDARLFSKLEFKPKFG